MKKILSILLSVAILLSCVSMVVFAVDGPQSENLLPMEMSTFDGLSGAYSHANLGWRGESNRFSSVTVENGAVKAVKNSANWVDTAANPAFNLGGYINSFAQANPAQEYQVFVSVDIKGTTTATNVVLQGSTAGNQWGLNYLGATTNVNAESFTTISNTFTFTAEQALAATDASCGLCLENSDKGSVMYYDNITLKITPIGIAVPETPVGLLPTSISTFGSDGVTTHTNMGFIGESNRFSTPSIVDGAFCVTKKTGTWVESYASPAWFLASYMQAFAAENPASEYTVYVSMDIKGNPGSASLAFRNSTAGNQHGINYFGSTASVTADAFTTVEGTLTLTADQINSADAAQGFALCIEGFAQGGTAYIDNVVLQMEAIKVPDPIGLLPVEISVLDKVGVTSHAHMSNSVDLNRVTTYSIIDGAFYVKKATGSWVEEAAAPTWLLGSYIKAYAEVNPAKSYTVNVSMDVKGAISDTSLIFRNSNAGNRYNINYFESASFNADSYTTVSGTVVLTADQIAAATDSSYALCLENIDKGAGVYFDNIVLDVQINDNNTIKGATLDLGSTLTINYYAKLDDAHKDAVMVVTRNDKTETITGVYDEAYGLYKFAYTGLNPQCMTDNIAAELTFDGEVLDAKAKYSVKTYLTNMLAVEDPADANLTSETKLAALKQLAKDVLVYGAQAQKYMNYNVADLATTDAVSGTLTAPAELSKSVMNTDEANKVASATLNVSNTVKVLFTVKLANEDLTVKVNGQDAELVATKVAGEYQVFAPGATALEFNKAYTITITDGATEISNVVYSVNDYIAYIAAKGEASSMYTFTLALSNYGTSAVAYVNAQ